MLRILVLIALFTAPGAALGQAATASDMQFDADRAIDRYFEEFEDCRFHGGYEKQPSCQALKIYSDALEENGWCKDGTGVEFGWIKC